MAADAVVIVVGAVVDAVVAVAAWPDVLVNLDLRLASSLFLEKEQSDLGKLDISIFASRFSSSFLHLVFHGILFLKF